MRIRASKSTMQWWEAPRGEAGELLAAAVEALVLHPEHLAREDRYLDYARLHSNVEIRNLRYYGGDAWETPDTIHPTAFGYNVCKAAPDTVASKLAENPARVTVSTNGGSRRDRRKAELASRFIDGLFWSSGFTSQRERAKEDALVFDIGAIKWTHRKGVISAKRVLPWELAWDPSDGRDGDPYCLYHPQRMHWAQVFAQWDVSEEDREKIRASASSGQVWVDEGWCRPYELPTQDEREAVLSKFPRQPERHGRHVVQCCGVTLLDEPFCYKRHRIVPYRWDKRDVGFAGQGLVEQVLPYYAEILRVLESWRARHKLGSVLRVAMQMGTQTQGISNQQGERFLFKTTPPSFFVPDVRSGEGLSDAGELWRKALEVTGLSLMDVGGRKEPGIDSGRAIREFRAVTSERFAKQVKAYDWWAVANAEAALDLAREIYEDSQELVVRAPGTKFLEQIDWSQIDMDEDAWVLQPEPTGALPRDIAGKKQQAEEWRQNGVINRLQYLELIQTADELSTVAMELAPKRRIERMIDGILDDGAYETPDEFVAFDLAIRLGIQALSDAEQERVPERRIRLLRRWIDEVARMQKLVEQGGNEAAARAAEVDQAAAAATLAANGNPMANPAGAPMAPTAPVAAPAGPPVVG